MIKHQIFKKRSFSTLYIVQFCFSNFFEEIRSDKNLFNTFFLAVCVFILAVMCNVSLPLILKFIVKSLESIKKNHQLIFIAILGYGFMWIVAQVGEHIREIASVRVIERVLRKLTLNFYQAVISQDTPHEKSIATGAIINKLFLFRDGFQNLVWGLLFFLFPTIVEIVCACSVLLYLYDSSYSVSLLVTTIIYAACTAYGVFYYLKHQTQTLKVSNNVFGFLSDRLYNIETVNCFSDPKREIFIFNEKLIKLENKTKKTKQIFESIRIVQGLIIGLALTFVTYKSIDNILQGNQDLSDFILINGYVIQFFLPLSSLGLVMNDIYKSFAEVAGFLDLFPSRKDDISGSENRVPDDKLVSLSVKRLNFSYESNNSSFSLKDINISLKPGWKLGIVGSSGSGKSTLGKILAGLYKPNSGEIFLNGASYSEYDKSLLKKKIAIAPQHVQLFCDTVLANIIYANPNATLEELQNAIKVTQLEEVIDKLPSGLDTFLGEQGTLLSGGEKQKIGIARAILKKSLLYIFDEPASFLDLKTEKGILDYFSTQQKKVTQIIITHRIHTIMDADWVLVMKDGKIISQGSPRYLVNHSQAFKRLYELDKSNLN